MCIRDSGTVDTQYLQQTRITLRQADARLHPYLKDALGEDVFEEVADKPVEELDENQREIVESVLGWWRQNEVYRQLVLSAISELWVDYLTRVEALRVSIGLEAYAQRDPLVQYKGRASEMFGELLAEIRAAVISRMFTLRPRQANAASSTTTGGQTSPALASAAQSSLPAPAPTSGNGANTRPAGQPSGGGKKKHKRH